MVKAVDEDLASTCGNRKPCFCADIAYKLITGDADIFALNQTSGEVSIKNTKKLTTGGEYSLAVKALPAKGIQTEEPNVEDDDDENVFRLTVFVEEELGRVKRQLQSSPSTRKKNTKNTADQSAFKNVESFATSFGLRTVAGEVNSLQVGSSIHYRLEIALPRATIDLFLEIYTKDSHTGNKSYPALSLYNFTIPHRVSGIAFATPEPQFFLSNKSRNVVSGKFEKGFFWFWMLKWFPLSTVRPHDDRLWRHQEHRTRPQYADYLLFGSAHPKAGQVGDEAHGDDWRRVWKGNARLGSPVADYHRRFVSGWLTYLFEVTSQRL